MNQFPLVTNEVCWVHRLGALFPHSRSLLGGSSSTTSHSWPLSWPSLISTSGVELGVQSATLLFCLLKATQLANSTCWQPFLELWSPLGGQRPAPLWGGCSTPAPLCLAGQVLGCCPRSKGVSQDYRGSPNFCLSQLVQNLDREELLFTP